MYEWEGDGLPLQRRARILVAGTGSGSGKTTVTLGLIRAFARQGLNVQGFKCGPDYIDPAYHAAVTGRSPRNLDSWMTSGEYLLEYFLRSSAEADLSVIEGVMGLYDGKEATGLTGSTAEIAILTESPVLLVLDVRSMGRSAAAIVLGFQQLELRVRIAAVIVNRCGSASHYQTVKAAIEAACGIPVLGWLLRDSGLDIPERHLGLLPAVERGELEPLFDRAADLLAEGTDLSALLQLAGAAPPLRHPLLLPEIPLAEISLFGDPPQGGSPAEDYPVAASGCLREDQPAGIAETGLPTNPAPDLHLSRGVESERAAASQRPDQPEIASKSAAIFPAVSPSSHLPIAPSLASASYQPPVHPIHPSLVPADYRPVLAVAHDAAFNFYYTDNLELLVRAGARLAEFSPLRGEGIPPDADGIYIGGGFPEEFASVIAGNKAFLNGIRSAAAGGMPLYAECGGYMVLARSLTDRSGNLHEMAGIIPAHTVMQERRAALGYREVTAIRDCLLLQQGETLRGHEFHYSVMSYDHGEPRTFAYESKGRGGSQPEGYVSGNVMAAYAHIHLASYLPAAARFVAACRAYHERK
ncbi:cobyrinate a,c-diamide synthase [Paenibacillus sp. FSL H7-0357]|uniref:cobyrinate a,c-diamide synthase n=1 Tax=Paenibacillus sp. FSL H7-0357 TaxID=1536774 RepID=UPI000AA294FC|nr:cobyrinate a,c-diamide synthase [Paenibacillus sp. FSL H7-0357]